MRFLKLGKMALADALQRQETLVEALAAGREKDTVPLVEHLSVYTVRRAGEAATFWQERDFDRNPLKLVRIGRGGGVTFHGPGQPVAYPHLDLGGEAGVSIATFCSLEAVLTRLAVEFDVPAFRREGLTVGPTKVSWPPSA